MRSTQADNPAPARRACRQAAPVEPPRPSPPPLQQLAGAAVLGILALLPALCTPASAQSVRLLVQSSPLAGFRHHEAPQAFPHMQVGDALELIREPDNRHDPSAVGVAWRGLKLGYVPRRQNDAVAWALDRGEPMSARISRLQEHRNPRLRVEFEIFVE